MKLMKNILSKGNLQVAIKKVKQNKGLPGIYKMTVQVMEEVLQYLTEVYEWIVDLDIEKFFDTVNHDKLILILRENVREVTIVHLIRAYLRAGVLDNGLIKSTTVGTPQG